MRADNHNRLFLKKSHAINLSGSQQQTFKSQSTKSVGRKMKFNPLFYQ